MHINLDDYTYMAPDGTRFIFRYALEEFIPTHFVETFNQFLAQGDYYEPIPMAAAEPMYRGYDPEHIAGFLLRHISVLPGIDHITYGTFPYEERATVPRDEAPGGVADVSLR